MNLSPILAVEVVIWRAIAGKGERGTIVVREVVDMKILDVAVEEAVTLAGVRIAGIHGRATTEEGSAKARKGSLGPARRGRDAKCRIATTLWWRVRGHSTGSVKGDRQCMIRPIRRLVVEDGRNRASIYLRKHCFCIQWKDRVGFSRNMSKRLSTGEGKRPEIDQHCKNLRLAFFFFFSHLRDHLSSFITDP